MAAWPPITSDRSAGSRTARKESFLTSIAGASWQTLLQCAHPLLVPRQREMAMISEVTLAPVRSESCLEMAVAALAELADLARHFPTFDRAAQAATQGTFEQAPRATGPRLDRRDAPRRATRVWQIGIGPAVQSA